MTFTRMYHNYKIKPFKCHSEIYHKSETKKQDHISAEYYSSPARFAVPLLSQLAFSILEQLLSTIFTTAKKVPLRYSTTVCPYPTSETITSQ
jgi:hypothetical protein